MLVLIWTCFQYIHLAPCGLYTGWLMTTSVVLWNNKCCFIYCRSSIVICSVHWVVWSLQIAYYVIIAGSQQLEVVEYLLVGLQRGEGNFQFDDIALPPSLFSWVSFFNNQHHCCTPWFTFKYVPRQFLARICRLSLLANCFLLTLGSHYHRGAWF